MKFKVKIEMKKQKNSTKSQAKNKFIEHKIRILNKAQLNYFKIILQNLIMKNFLKKLKQ